jgi:hypothetical protein
MTRKKVFVSYDYDHDHAMKGSFISQSRDPHAQFSIIGFSLPESLPEDEWLAQTNKAISKCDVFVVLLGADTHSAAGVLREAAIARELKKKRFQLKPQGKEYGKVPGAGDVVAWKSKNLQSRLD